MSGLLQSKESAGHDVLFAQESPGKLELLCSKCKTAQPYWAINMTVACEMATEQGWFLEGGENLVCPKCPGIRPKGGKHE